MGFRVFVQATFAAQASVAARAARDKAHDFVTAVSSRETIESTGTKVLDERTAFRFRFEMTGPALRDDLKMRTDVTTLGMAITKLGGKLVTLNINADDLLPPSDSSLAAQLASTKQLADTRTKQLAVAQKRVTELEAQLAIKPSSAAAPATTTAPAPKDGP